MKGDFKNFQTVHHAFSRNTRPFRSSNNLYKKISRKLGKVCPQFDVSPGKLFVFVIFSMENLGLFGFGG